MAGELDRRVETITQGLVEANVDGSDLQRLAVAVDLLENPSLAARLTNLIGLPVEWVVKALPAKAASLFSTATERTMAKALRMAVSTMKPRHPGTSAKWSHRFAGALSGGIGGFFGLAGMMVELPISTVIILRSIADVARSQGEDIRAIDTRLACLQVFALGGRGKEDDAAETGYYATRLALARVLSEAGEYIAKKGLAEEGAPVIVRLISKLSARFGSIVSEKVAAEIVPVAGALGGATINMMFVSHFQAMARGHFIVRALERRYGPGPVKEAYDRIARSQ